MSISINRWIERLVRDGSLSAFIDDMQTYYRLSSPLEFIISKEIVAILSQEYDPGNEKGGLILAAIKKINGKIILEARKLQFLGNRSNTRAISYQPDETEFRASVEAAFSKKLIPLIFHTHPTQSNNVVNFDKE